MPASSLPTTTAFLTTLFTALSDLPKPTPTPAAEAPGAATTATHPLTCLQANPSAKNIFLTLHVLFPHEFLPALDVLDRRLITRLSIHNQAAEPSEAEAEQQQQQEQEQEQEQQRRWHQHSIYAVRSAQHPRPRPRSSGSASSSTLSLPVYIVRTRAWSCSCPAFAFSAFPPPAAAAVTAAAEAEAEAEAPPEQSSFRDLDRKGEEDGGIAVERHATPDSYQSVVEGRFRFGGLLLLREEEMMGGVATTTTTTTTPICKHLLACVLAERWEGFAAFVEERAISGEEMAGWSAGMGWVSE